MIMPAPQRVRTWIAQNYKKPVIDQEWLADCSDWVSSELGLDPATDFDQFIQQVEAQLLQSNLADSTVPGTGIDPLLVTPNPAPVRQPRPRQKKTTGPTPLLVEIKSITEIAHSAFSLLNIHQTRLDRADLGLAQEENAGQHGEDEGPVPKFPRGMLRFELSDGLTTFKAIEFRSLSELKLGTTPLGYKIFLKSTPIRNNIAFLEPANVTLLGYRTEDHDVNSEQVFLSSLRRRLGRPDPPPEAPAAAQPQINPPVQPARQPQPVAKPPSPPPDFDDMYVEDDIDPDVLREMAIQMDEAEENQRANIPAPPPTRPLAASREKKPSSNPKQSLGITSSPRTLSSTSSVKASPYFATNASEPKLKVPDIGLSPRPVPPPESEVDFDITWDVDNPEPTKVPVRKLGSTSAKSSSTAPAKHVARPENRATSPDLYDDISFDMDVDESFFEQVGLIEQGALDAGSNNKGKGKDDGTQSTKSHGHPRIPSPRKTTSGSVVGRAKCSSPSARAEPGTRVQRRAERAHSPSSLSGSTGSPIPRSTQSSNSRPPRDPSLIILSSSEDEVPGSHSIAKPFDPAEGRARKRIKMDQEVVPDSEVIDISD